MEPYRCTPTTPRRREYAAPLPLATLLMGLWLPSAPAAAAADDTAPRPKADAAAAASTHGGGSIASSEAPASLSPAPPAEEILVPAYLIGVRSGSVFELVDQLRGNAPHNGSAAAAVGTLGAVPPTAMRSQDYVIGAQDLLEVTVLNADSLNRTVRVSDDGSITLPLVGEMLAGGRTKKELERLIASSLTQDYVRDAQVSVFIREATSKRISVSGAVRNPGSFELLGRRTLLEALSDAGGVVPDLAVDRLIILRRTPQGTRSIPVDLDALVVQTDPHADLELQPGDIVHVPVANFIDIYVNGAVRRPDVYKIKVSEPATLLQVITMAGGVTERGSERRVQIMRRTPAGETQLLSVNLQKVRKGKIPDPALQKADVVIVPDARF